MSDEKVKPQNGAFSVTVYFRGRKPVTFKAARNLQISKRLVSFDYRAYPSNRDRHACFYIANLDGFSYSNELANDSKQQGGIYFE